MKWVKYTILTVFVFAFALTVQIFQPNASAHPFDVGVVKSKLVVNGKQIILTGETSDQTILTKADEESERATFEEYVSETFTIKNQDKDCEFKLNDFRVPDSNKIIYKGAYVCSDNIVKLSDLSIRSILFADFFNKIEHFVDLEKGPEKVKIVFNKDTQEYPKPEATSEDQKPTETQEETNAQEEKQANNISAIAKEFTRIGAEHIWFGYDHVLFLIMLVLLLRSPRKILKIVTAFTIAHSITLLLAGFDIVTISPDIIEPIIALTIVFVAIQNIIHIKKKEIDQHVQQGWIIAAVFGLIHGLGFAGALKDLEIPSENFVPSLIFFNVGVELGQIILLLIIVPLLLLVDKSKWRYRFLAAIAAIVGIQALVWFIQRIV